MKNLRGTLVGFCLPTAVGILGVFMGPAPIWAAGSAEYVIEVTVDGLGSTYLEALLTQKPSDLPNFQRLQNEGAFTFNARCDYDISVTLPNHVSVVTGRSVLGTTGHGWVGNVDPLPGETIHNNNGSYIPSVFDVAHDAGGRTSLFAGKTKFSLISTSYNATNGAVDLVGPVDNGRNKIDFVRVPTTGNDATASGVVTAFVSEMSANPFNYSLVHLMDTDVAGGWGSASYNAAIRDVDGYLGQILNLVQTDSTLAGKTTVIVTADHGGQNGSHSRAYAYLNYRIPFFVWGAGVTGGAELYGVNAATRQDPGIGRPNYSVALQPIRNSDGANLALGLLGQGAIAGSTVNANQDLAVAGVAVKTPVIVAHNVFNQATVGSLDFQRAPGDKELNFTTTRNNALGGAVFMGVYDSSTSPLRYRMQAVDGEVMFEKVALAGYSGVTAEIDILIKPATYGADDYFKAILDDGAGNTIDLANVQGADLNALTAGAFYHYVAQIPDAWTEATLRISSYTGATAETKAVDFDNIIFRAAAVPAPSSMAMAAVGLVGLLMSRRRGWSAQR